MTITLIHPFEVSIPETEKFSQTWKNIDIYMRERQGFITTKLHKSIDNPSGHKNTIYNFINIAIWQTALDFQNAISTDQFINLSKDIFAFSRYPGMYEVIED